MEPRPLGRTGLTVSALGFGCGAIGGLMVQGDPAEQRQAVARALAAGVTYFDTAPLYGSGRSESNLGRALRELGAWDRVVVGTKVRLASTDLDDPPAAIRRSLEESLRRLGRDEIDLLQLHNPLGQPASGPLEQPDAVSLEDVLGPIAEGLVRVRDAGLAKHIGFTGLGDSDALRVAALREPFETVQAYYNPLNPSAGFPFVCGGGQDFGGLIDTAARAGLGVIAIRVFAGGALTDTPAAAVNATVPGRALAAGGEYASDRDRGRSRAALAIELGLENSRELALRFALTQAGVSTALIGFSTSEQLEQAVRWAGRGPLAPDAVQRIVDQARD